MSGSSALHDNSSRLALFPLYMDIYIHELLQDPEIREQVPRDATRGELRRSAANGEPGDDLVGHVRIQGSCGTVVGEELAACLVRDGLGPFPDLAEASEAGKEVISTVRAEDGRREFSLTHPELGEVKGAVVNGLANARALVEDLLEGYVHYDFVEVMACPGGCVCGAGQPVNVEEGTRRKRAESLRQLDTALDLHASGENHMVWQAYERYLGGGPDSHEAHHLLHTKYKSRRRIQSDDLTLSEVTGEPKIPVRVCLGTGCQLRGAQDLLRHLLDWSDKDEKAERFDIRATFCMETCDKGPTVHVGESILCQATFDKVTLLMDDVIHETDSAEGATV